MAGKIFISYRRDDAAGDARGIRDALVAKYDPANVFMDIDNLLAGQRFDRELSKALDACDVLLALIGPRWMDQLTTRTQSGERDYVREEIAAALRRGIVVIPVRVGLEGRMPPLPRGADLPEDIRDLVLHQKHDVAHERFGRDVRELIEAIEAAFDEREREMAVPVLGGRPSSESRLPVPSVVLTDVVSQELVKPAPVVENEVSPLRLQKGVVTEREPQEGQNEPRPGGRLWARVAAVFVAALALGSAIAYTYRSLVTPSRAPVAVANSAPATVKSEQNRGGLLAYQTGDNKILDRLDGDAPHPSSIPGTLLDNLEPGSTAAVTSITPSPPQKVASTQPTPSAPQPGTGTSYAVVLASQKSRADALKMLPELQGKYASVLAGRKTDVLEANLGPEKGVWYRLVTGPHGTRDAASTVCSQLKAVGYPGCYVMSY